MIDYQSFYYIYPPRPKNAIPHSDLSIYDNQSMLGQPKINGSNCTIYTNGKDVYVYNRHGQKMTGFDIPKSEILSLHKKSGWLVLNGEYTNKAKRDHNQQLVSNKFCIFDILVDENKYLVGSTFQERVERIYNKFTEPSDYITPISENIFVVKTFNSNFNDIYHDLVKIDLIEGLVLKRKNAKLEVGSTENNNTKSQIKARKPTKNYKF